MAAAAATCRRGRPSRRGGSAPWPRPAVAGDAAVQLDLYYCLDWAYLEAERRRLPLPGQIDSNAIGQRRWALEWAVVFTGPVPRRPARLGRRRPVDLSPVARSAQAGSLQTVAVIGSGIAPGSAATWAGSVCHALGPMPTRCRRGGAVQRQLRPQRRRVDAG